MGAGHNRRMRESSVRDALRRIEDVVLEATGKALDAPARKRVASALTGLAGGASGATAEENFSQREATIMFADLRGFTALAAAHPAAMVLELLNRCFSAASEAIVRQGGTIDKFAGDSVMAVFSGRGGAQDVRHAVLCAVEMQGAMDALNRRHAEAGLPALYMGIGINTGRVLAGLVGSELYWAYTVIGEEVNLTSRIEAFSLRGQVLISESTYELCRDLVAAGEPMEVYVKGRSARVRLREVLGIPSLELKVPRHEMRRSPRIQVMLPFHWQKVAKKIVLPERRSGRILDIGYHGVLVEGHPEMPLHAELKLEVDVPLVGHVAKDVYARVVNRSERAGKPLAGLEFTSLAPDTNAKLQLFVQMLLQGHGV